ncbi:hypothetical protein BDZ91DRAFT_733622 [Kalaharituber pfeilii]|nr:hypothetical protein BDZ91DRAFT_733622 [Kalaharituber pfeilii]
MWIPPDRLYIPRVKSLNSEAAPSLTANDPLLKPKSEEEMRAEAILAGIKVLQKKLKSKKEMVTGQNYQRHLAVLHFSTTSVTYTTCI